jgi:hypothetical protein
MGKRRIEAMIEYRLQRIAKAGFDMAIVDEQRRAAAGKQPIGNGLHDRAAGRGDFHDRAGWLVGMSLR